MDMINRYNYRSGLGLLMGMILGIIVYLPILFLTKNVVYIVIALAFGVLIGGSFERYFNKKFELEHNFGSHDETCFRLYTIVGICLAVLVAILVYIANLHSTL